MATAGVAVAALWFTGQSLHATQNQYGLSEQGQITDRFGKAIEHLGSDKIDIRLGAIYALERLARDSPADHPTVFEVLSSFIRTHAPVWPLSGPPCGYRNVPAENVIAVDIQAAVTVIGRRDSSHDGPNPIDLSKSCLVVANLSATNLAGAILYLANLDGANLDGAHLDGAHLNEAHMFGADLRDTDLQGAHLGAAILNWANLTGKDLRGTDLQGAYLKEASLDGADLRGTDLKGAHLDGANLNEANLNGADLNGADLNGADLTGADLTGADLTGTDLTGTDLRGTDLADANLKDIRYNGDTKWPDGFTPPPNR
ncbi:pentapeptide repeat-containing protein [Nocardia gipuzkoensis]